MSTHSYMREAIDFETFSNHGQIVPYCCCFSFNNENHVEYYGDSNLFLRVLHSICDLISKTKHKSITFYAHNLNFDGILIIQTLSYYDIHFNYFMRGWNLYFLTFTYVDIHFTFKCSYKLLPLSLERLGLIIGYPKIVFPYNFISLNTLFYDNLLPNTDIHFNTKLETIKYCYRDIDIVNKILNNIFEIIKLIYSSSISDVNSAASLSLKIFFKKFNSSNLMLKIPQKYADYIRLGYFGGRCEVFGNPTIDEEIKYFDFSSMYASCMTEKMPLGNILFKNNPTNIDLPGWYTITFVSSFEFPILPIHSTINNKLIFLNGELTGTYWFEEILLFKENGGQILKIHSCLVFEKYECVFIDYVNYFINLRKQGGYFDYFGKLMNNSLYGGFALDTDISRTILTFSESEYHYILKNNTVISASKLNNIFIITISTKDCSPINSRNVAISACITSKARCKLYNLFILVMNEGGRLLYCDTDSVFAAYPANVKSKINWLNTYKDAIFCKPKTYILKKHNGEIECKLKGINNVDLNFNDFKNKFYNNEKNYLFKNQFQILRHNLILNDRHYDKYIFINDYDKRIFTANKTRTIPINHSLIETS